MRPIRRSAAAGVAAAALLAAAFAIPVHPARQGEKPLPDKERFIQEFRGALRRDAKLLADYTYTEKLTEIDLDSSGKPKKTTIQVYQVLHGAEEWQTYRRQITKDGKPQSAKELEKQDREEAERVAKEARKRAGWSESKRKEELAKEQKKEREIMDDVFALYEVQLVRREVVEGRPMILVTYKARPNYKPKTDEGKILRKIAGRAWIAEDDRQLARLEAETTDTISVGAGLLARVSKGSVFSFERRKVNDEIWLPTRAELMISGRLLLLKGLRQRQTVEYSDHRKYTVDTVVKPVEP
jgi:hypothetical protein